MSLFMSKEESDRRLRDSRNVLQRVDRGGSALGSEDYAPPVIPSFDLNSPGASADDVKHERDKRAPAAEPVGNSKEQDILDPTLLLQIDQAIHGSRGPGRKPGIRNRTNEENGSIGLSKLLLGGPAVEDMFGVSSAVSTNLTKGYTGSVPKAQHKSPKDELLDEVYKQGKEVQTRAFSKLLKSLDLLDSPDGEGPQLKNISSPVKLVQVAKGLSGIIKDMTPRDTGPQEQSVHFHVYIPEQNTEDAYETIEVGTDGSVTVRS